jgi:hypothetical protein
VRAEPEVVDRLLEVAVQVGLPGVGPTRSERSKIVMVSMPARFSATPVAMPPKPAPTTATIGVPAGPNRSTARLDVMAGLALTGRCSACSSSVGCRPDVREL